MDDSVASARFHDAKVALVHCRWSLGLEWWSLIERAVGSVLVVVPYVVDDESLELSLVPDDGAVEEFAADRSDWSGRRWGWPLFWRRRLVGWGCG